jgi:GTP cyclohydrolase I
MIEKELAEQFNTIIGTMPKEVIRELAVRMLLSSIPEEEIGREGLIDTPSRVSKMYDEIFAGYEQSPKEILSTVFEDDTYGDNVGDMVIVKDIPFYSHCEHHIVPFFGVVHVAYIPNKKVLGISKLARLVDCFARRLQIQERLTGEIADMLVRYADPNGVAVVVEAEHMCMTMRGVKKPGAKTQTAAMRGVFMSDPATRAEFYQLIK